MKTRRTRVNLHILPLAVCLMGVVNSLRTPIHPSSMTGSRSKMSQRCDCNGICDDATPPAATNATPSRRIFLNGLMASSIVSGISLGAIVGGPEKADAAYSTRVGGLTNKIRSICGVLDELQRDLMQENWELVETYPVRLRSYVPVFTTYTDAAFPTEEATDKALRVALRYEVGRFFASLERFRQATSRRSIDEAYIAYSDMALHFDRYLHTGNLYTYEDSMISTETLYQGFKDSDLVYSNPKKDPAEPRDLVVLAKGPDKGKTGIVIGVYRDGSNNCVIKLDKNRRQYGIREIRVVPLMWAAKRLGEQDPDDVFLIPRKPIKKAQD